MAVPNPLPRTADGLPAGKGSDITDGGGGFTLTLPDWIDVVDEALDEQVARFDLTNVGDLTFDDPVMNSGTSTVGNVRGANFHVRPPAFTMTSDVDATDYTIGSPFIHEYNFTAHAGDTTGPGAIGPQVVGGYRGPMAAFNFIGVGYWTEHQKVYSPDPMAFGDFHTERLDATGDRNAQFSWSFLSARYRIADGHVWTVLNNDTRNGPIPFFDNAVYFSGNGGEIDGTTSAPSYPIGDNFSEIDLETGRWISSFSAGLHMYGNVEFTGYAMFAGHDMNTELTNPTGPTFIELGETAISGAVTIDASTTYPVQTQVMFYSPRLVAGAANYAAILNSHVALWGDDYTFDDGDATFHTPNAVLSMGLAPDGSQATHTYDFTNSTQNLFEVSGRWEFAQAASPLGGFSAVNVHPTIGNTAAASGVVMPLGVLFNASPVYSMTTAGGAVVLSDLRTFYSRPVFTRAGGSNSMTVGGHASFHAGMLVNANVGVLLRKGVYIEDATGSGTMTTQVGIEIDAMTFASTNIGLRNASTTRLVAATTFGADSAATWLMHLKGGNSATNALGLDPSTTAATTPATSGAVLQHYQGSGGGHYALFTYRDGSTTRYKYMPLDGTSTTWTHATTLPT